MQVRVCAAGHRSLAPIQGYMITHNKSISIADYLTLREDGRVIYRPTCHYAYHPCDDAIFRCTSCKATLSDRSHASG